jgi:hypothetical protein
MQRWSTIQTRRFYRAAKRSQSFVLYPEDSYELDILALKVSQSTASGRI